MLEQEYSAQIAALEAENFILKEQIAQLKRLLFSQKRERHVGQENPQQGVLFELEAAVQAKEEALEVLVKRKQKKAPRIVVKRNEFPANLRRETEVIQPQGVRPDQLDQLVKIGEDTTEILAYTPADVYVKKIVRPRYADQQHPENGVQQAPIPPRIIPKGMVDESLIAQIIVEKIQFHTPVYRFAKKLKQLGIPFIKENNLHNWFHRSAESLRPLHTLLIEDILSQGYTQMDESPIKVLSKNKPGSTHKGYMWVNYAPTIQAVAFTYDKSRASAVAQEILEGYTGFLQTDGYVAYDSVAKHKSIELVHCMAHARRKFFEAKESDPDRANYFLNRVQRLYQIERQAKEQQLSIEHRQQLRQQQAAPILEELRQWLTHQYADKTILPKSLMRKAIQYAFQRWTELSTYAQQGVLEIDNNLVENTIRPMAIGRKNYLFAGSHDAAQNLAVLYSLVGTCEKNGINPKMYLEWLLRKVASHKVTAEAVQWLPHRVNPELFQR